MQSERFFLNPNLKLENTYMTLPSHLFSKLLPNLVPMPKLILFNHTLAHEIGFPINSFTENCLRALLSKGDNV